MESKLTLAEKVKEARLKMGFSKLKLSKLAKLNYGTIKRLEYGRTKNPFMDTLEKISAVLDIDVEVFVRE